MLSVFALSRQAFARLRRARDGEYVMAKALRAFAITYSPSGERRGREQTSVYV
jgi:hypothetical protein